MISASKIGLLRECAYWARADVEQDARTESDEAARGTTVHEAVDHFVKTWLRLPLEGDEGAMFGHALAWLDNHPCLESEVAYAWDPATDRGADLDDSQIVGHRAYADPVHWEQMRFALDLSERAIPMTLDLLEFTETGAVVYDWCTGRTHKLAQLQMNALAVARTNGLESVRIVTLRLTPEGCTEEDMGMLDSIDFDLLASEFRLLLESVPTSLPKPGSHCTELYCPAKGSCPVTRTALAEIVPAAALTRFRFTDKIESMEHASQLLPMMKLADAYTDNVRKALQAYAVAHGDIPTTDGKAWGKGTRKDRRFNKDLAIALLKQLGATDAQIAALNKEQVVDTYSERKVRA